MGTGAQSARGTAGTTITAGQAIYLDSATNTLKLADADTSGATAGVAVGISVHAALSGQPLTYITSGLLNMGNCLTKGQVYVVGATAGAINPASDLVSTWYTTVLGIASDTSTLNVGITVSGVALA